MVISICVLLVTTLQCVLSQPLPLSEADIQELVSAHNFFRGMVDPPASNMQRVQWNEELARVAQAYAEMCQFRDNPNRADNVSFPTVGESLSASNTRSPNYTEFVERSWFNQRVNYDYQTNMCSSPGSCTDYVQLAGANTTELGCGAAQCRIIDGFPLPNSILLVCNYAPETDLSQGQPYQTGEPCSQCRDDQNICIMNICSSIPPEIVTTPLPVALTTTGLTITTDAEGIIATTEEESSQSSSSDRTSGSKSESSQSSSSDRTSGSKSESSRSSSSDRTSGSKSESSRSSSSDRTSGSKSESSRSSSSDRTSGSKSESSRSSSTDRTSGSKSESSRSSSTDRTSGSKSESSRSSSSDRTSGSKSESSRSSSSDRTSGSKSDTIRGRSRRGKTNWVE